VTLRSTRDAHRHQRHEVSAADGRLYACHKQGEAEIIAIDKDGKVEVLATDIGCNDPSRIDAKGPHLRHPRPGKKQVGC